MAYSQGQDCREQARAMVAALSGVGADWNARDERGRSCAHVAAQAGDVEFLAMLAKAGCDLDAIDSRGRSALSIAADKRALSSFEVAAALLNLGAHPDAGRTDQRSALALAIERGDEPLFDLLVSHGASDETLRETDWEEKGAWVDTLLRRAQNAPERTQEKRSLALLAQQWASCAQEERVLEQEAPCAPSRAKPRSRLCVKRGAVEFMGEERGASGAREAIELWGMGEKVGARVALGAARQKEILKNTHRAIEQLDADHFKSCASLLQDAGGAIPWESAAGRCFEASVDAGQRADFLKGLFAAGLDAKLGVKDQGMIAWAVGAFLERGKGASQEPRAPEWDMLSALSAAGAHWGGRDYYGNNAAHLAAARGDETLLTFLADKPLNWSELNKAGESPLVLALRAGAGALRSGALAGIILRAGAHPEAGRYKGMSALCMAVGRGHPEWVDLLISHGATGESLLEIIPGESMSALDALAQENRRFRGNQTVESLIKKVAPWAQAMRERRDMATGLGAARDAGEEKAPRARPRSL